MAKQWNKKANLETSSVKFRFHLLMCWNVLEWHSSSHNEAFIGWCIAISNVA